MIAIFDFEKVMDKQRQELKEKNISEFELRLGEIELKFKEDKDKRIKHLENVNKIKYIWKNEYNILKCEDGQFQTI